MFQKVLDKIKPKLEKVKTFFENELLKIRTSNVSPNLIENLKVECYGSVMPLKQVATISRGEKRELIIAVWDKNNIKAVERAIFKSNLGVSPIVGKNIIRVCFPALTKEYRERLLKIVKDKSENSKITIRMWRDEAKKEIREMFKKGEIKEDDKFKGEEKLQELIDDYIEEIKKLTEAKIKEIMEN